MKRLKQLACLWAISLLPVTLPADAYLQNISARALVGEGDNQEIAGFVLAGSGTKQVLLRAAGQGLAPLGVNTSLNPQLTLIEPGATTPIHRNDEIPVTEKFTPPNNRAMRKTVPLSTLSAPVLTPRKSPRSAARIKSVWSAWTKSAAMPVCAWSTSAPAP